MNGEARNSLVTGVYTVPAMNEMECRIAHSAISK